MIINLFSQNNVLEGYNSVKYFKQSGKLFHFQAELHIVPLYCIWLSFSNVTSWLPVGREVITSWQLSLPKTTKCWLCILFNISVVKSICHITRKTSWIFSLTKKCWQKFRHFSRTRLWLSRILKFIPDLVECLSMSFIFVHEILESFIQRQKNGHAHTALIFRLENQFQILKANYQQL